MVGRHLAAFLAFAAAVWPAPVEAQPYPTRPVTIIVPFAAGGTFDTVARIIGVRMSELLGQSVIVENVTGAAGIIGVQRVINAKPDGYTVLLGTVGTHAYNQSMYRKRRYDAVSDFTPVTLFSDQPMVLESRMDLPVTTLAEFGALLKQNGTKMQYGPAANDLIGGQIDYMCSNISTAVGRAAAKQSKALALLSRERTPLMPDLATAHEQGITDYEVLTWTAFFLPKGASKDIVGKLNETTHAAMETPAIKKRFNDIGVIGTPPERRGPEYLAKYV